MKSEDLAIYRQIQKTAETAMKTMDTISDKIYDDQLAMQVSRQSLKYSEIYNTAVEQMIKVKAQPHHNSHLSDWKIKAGIHYNTLLNTSTGHIAELMIKGSNMGVLELNRILNHNEDAGDRSITLAKQFIEFEEKNIRRLIKYL